jgi:hypothetical protein
LIPTGAGIFLSAAMSRLALGPTQPPLKLVPEFFLRGKAANVKLTTHIRYQGLKYSRLYLYTLPRCGAYTDGKKKVKLSVLFFVTEHHAMKV